MYHQSWNGSSWQSEWDSLGGIFTSPPVAISREPNRLDVFGTETDDAIWHKVWHGSSWQEDWDSRKCRSERDFQQRSDFKSGSLRPFITKNDRGSSWKNHRPYSYHQDGYRESRGHADTDTNEDAFGYANQSCIIRSSHRKVK